MRQVKRADEQVAQARPSITGTFRSAVTCAFVIAVYYALETDPDAAIALSLVLLLVSIVVLVSLRDHWLRGGSLS